MIQYLVQSLKTEFPAPPFPNLAKKKIRLLFIYQCPYKYICFFAYIIKQNNFLII